MEEFVPKRKTKIFTKEFIAKYSYVLVLAVLLIGGISYGYTFFTENKKIASGSITTANLTINFSNREISASNLSVPSNDQEGLSEFSKSLTITNQTTIDGKVKLNITRTSGLALTDMRYALIVNGAIQEIDDVPSNGEILTNAIMGNETINVEVRLWPKTTYSGNTTTFVGEITPEISYLGTTATDTSNLTGKYVNFNCSSTCEVWQIVKVEDDRLVLTRQADYSGATSRTNSNKYNPSLTFNDNSLITSVSTDNKNVYLAKTVKINGGSGTQANPYTLINNEYREGDKKVIAVITYKHETTTIGTQNIYYNETNYISQVYNDPDFDSWTDGTNNYELGDVINISSDTNLTAVLVPKLSNRIMTLCNDSNIAYVKKYDVSNGTPIDTPDGSGTEDVCYYTSSDSSNLAGQNGNVIFGDYCWQIVRTTADGGVKLIYNGLKTNDNKCPNDNSLRPSSVVVNGSGAQKNIDGNKLYGTNFEIFDDNGTNKFRLKNTFTANWDGDYDNDGNLDYLKIMGTYVCGTSTNVVGDSNVCEYLYYVGYYYDDPIKVKLVGYTLGTNTTPKIGKTSFNPSSYSMSYVGYMFNDVYNIIKTNYITKLNIFETTRMGTGNKKFYFGEKATWNSNTNMYDLTVDDGNGNDIPPSTTNGYSSIKNKIVGMYTCLNDTDVSCATVYYIVGSSDTTQLIYTASLSNSETINTKEINWTYGTGYSESNGVYSLTGTNTITLLYKDWYTNYNNSSYKNIYVCDDFTSTTCPNQALYIGATNKSAIEYNESNNNFIFGNSVSYVNGNYIINQDNDSTKYQKVWDWYKSYKTINSSHYTCFKNDTDNCGSSVYYVYYSISNTIIYIELTGGDRIEDALEKMINTNNSTSSTINKYNSAIKGVVDNWYESNLIGLSNYLDNDAVFCNDRTYTDLAGWSPIGSVTSEMKFKYYNTSSASLSCVNYTDRFSKNNNIAKLTHSIGLLTEPERELMNLYYAKTGEEYDTMSAYSVKSNEAYVRQVNTGGDGTNGLTGVTRAVRPVIVLKPGVTITGGDGTYNTPYIIDINS